MRTIPDPDQRGPVLGEVIRDPKPAPAPVPIGNNIVRNPDGTLKTDLTISGPRHVPSPPPVMPVVHIDDGGCDLKEPVNPYLRPDAIATSAYMRPAVITYDLSPEERKACAEIAAALLALSDGYTLRLLGCI